MNPIIESWYLQHSNKVTDLADSLWSCPESAMHEAASCAAVGAFLADQGFEVTMFPVKDDLTAPNAIMAKYGAGKPVIGILGEYDALDGLGQEAVPHYSPKGGPGHGCGHNLMGAGCAGAAAALKQAIEEEKLSGTVIYYGCPAEETIQGKSLMIQAGCFDNVDLCLGWHPSGEALHVSEKILLANTNMLFSFHGITAHASGNPHLGRSALDAAELMNVGVNYLREHVPDGVRMHYVYTHAGEKPNIVPGYAQLHYFIRARSRQMADEVVERVKKVAQGAATMTETTVDWTVISSCCATKINRTFNQYLYQAARKINPVSYNSDEYEYAHALYTNVMNRRADQELLPAILSPLTGSTVYMSESSDISDVSQIVPTAQIMGLGMVNGLPGHHWSVVAAAGSSIGRKACLQAGKVLAQCGYDLLTNATAVDEIKKDFESGKSE